MSSDCLDCTAAAAGEWHGFTMNCRGCCARAAARTPQYHAARTAGRLDRPYRALLEQFGLTHDEVKAAADVDQLGKEPA